MMDPRAYASFSDTEITRELDSLFTSERVKTAQLLICLAEVESRKLHLPAGYSSMLDYCLKRYPLSRDSALNRIRVARAGRRCPALFDALADGRLSLTGAAMITQYVTPANIDDLITTMAFKTRFEIYELIAQRFPDSAAAKFMAARVKAAAFSGVMQLPQTRPPLDPMSSPLLALTPVQLPEQSEANSIVVVSGQLTSVSGEQRAGAPAEIAAGVETQTTAANPPTASPRPPARYVVQFAIGQSAFEALGHVKNLLAHQIPSGDLEQIFAKLLALAIPQLEKSKFGATERSQAHARPTASARHIPKHVQRAVWQRDGGRCTYVSADGTRCEARGMLEYDHVEPIARGGQSSIENLRLRCRGHNQMEAERAFGTGFMERKRGEARTSRRELPQDAAPPTPVLTEAARARNAELARAAVEQIAAHLAAAGTPSRERIPAPPH